MILELSALGMGLAGAAHCAGMCGGVVGLLYGPRDGPARALAYNLGRVGSYVLFGAVAGAVASAADAMPLPHVRAALRLVAALGALAVGLSLLGLARFDGFGAPVFRVLRPLAAKLLPARSALHAVLLGAIWGWLPCGLVYGALALALASSSAASGALVMLAFGAGTLPAMMALGALAARARAALDRPWVRRAAGAALVISGALGAVSALTQSSPERPHCAACS